MRGELVLEGAIPPDGIADLLPEVEATCVTGTLRFESALEGSGDVILVRGQFAERQIPDRRGRDPVDVLLSLREGRFTVRQRLPDLPVSSGDEGIKTGSLAVHVPSELMRYCERAGLTGTLRLTNDRREVSVVYARGELAEIRVEAGEPGEGEADGGMADVFGWEQGTFAIEAAAPDAAPARVGPLTAPPSREAGLDSGPADVSSGGFRLDRTDRTEKHQIPEADAGRPTFDQVAKLLRVEELSVEVLLKQAAEATPPSRTGPVIPELPAARPPSHSTELGAAAPSTPAPSSRPPREPTVKVIYLSGDRRRAERSPDAAPSEEVDLAAARHAPRDLPAEVKRRAPQALADAEPPAPAPALALAGVPRESKPRSGRHGRIRHRLGRRVGRDACARAPGEKPCDGIRRERRKEAADDREREREQRDGRSHQRGRGWRRADGGRLGGVRARDAADVPGDPRAAPADRLTPDGHALTHRLRGTTAALICALALGVWGAPARVAWAQPPAGADPDPDPDPDASGPTETLEALAPVDAGPRRRPRR